MSVAHQVAVPIEAANDITLGYYNCRLLSPGDVISLSERSIITDFHYQDDYFDRYVMGSLGGSQFEQHVFAHVNMPRDRYSGYLMIGKANAHDRSLEFTAFKVEPGDAVYIPAGTIHTNDYLLGTWRTLLSSTSGGPYALVKQPQDKPIRLIIGHGL